MRLGSGRSTPLEPGEKAIKIVSGMDHNLLLTSKGKVFGWGLNGFNHLGVGFEGDFHKWPFLVQFNDPHNPKQPFITDIFAGHDSSFFVADDGRLFGAGSNTYGLMATGDIKEFEDWKAHRIGGDLLSERVKSVACSPEHVVAVTESHHVYSWGNAPTYRSGPLGLPEDVIAPRRTLMWDRREAIQDDPEALEIIEMFQGGDTREFSVMTPTRIESLDQQRIVSVACGSQHTLCLSEDGQVFGFGANQCSQLGFEGNHIISEPIHIPLLDAKHATRICAGHDFSLVAFKQVASPF